MGIRTSRLFDRRAYRGRIAGEYRMRSPSAASRSRTLGWRTATGPMPVMISRSGRWPWRTTRCWPVAVFRSACFARNSATSASMAWVSSARAPLRRISVRESLKAPGWASLITLLSDTAYHSFIGEVEALNTTTIRRLIRSRRHQLLAIARSAVTPLTLSSPTKATAFPIILWRCLGGSEHGITQPRPHDLRWVVRRAAGPKPSPQQANTVVIRRVGYGALGRLDRVRGVRFLRLTCRADDGPAQPEMTQSGSHGDAR